MNRSIPPAIALVLLTSACFHNHSATTSTSTTSTTSASSGGAVPTPTAPATTSTSSSSSTSTTSTTVRTIPPGEIITIDNQVAPDDDKDRWHGASALARCTIFGTHSDDVIQGTDGDDVICGGDGDDQIFGGAGDDTIFPGPGNDFVDAGVGKDNVDFDGCCEDAYSLTAGNNTAHLGPGHDTASGGGGADVIIGGDGRDLIRGGPGNDVLIGGLGTDILHGEEGNDVLHAANALADGPLGDTAIGGPGSDLGIMLDGVNDNWAGGDDSHGALTGGCTLTIDDELLGENQTHEEALDCGEFGTIDVSTNADGDISYSSDALQEVLSADPDPTGLASLGGSTGGDICICDPTLRTKNGTAYLFDEVGDL